MARRCELSGKGPLTGNLVSHSQRHPNYSLACRCADLTGSSFRGDRITRSKDSPGTGFSQSLAHIAAQMACAASNEKHLAG